MKASQVNKGGWEEKGEGIFKQMRLLIADPLTTPKSTPSHCGKSKMEKKSLWLTAEWQYSKEQHSSWAWFTKGKGWRAQLRKADWFSPYWLVSHSPTCPAGWCCNLSGGSARSATCCPYAARCVSLPTAWWLAGLSCFKQTCKTCNNFVFTTP